MFNNRSTVKVAGETLLSSRRTSPAAGSYIQPWEYYCHAHHSCWPIPRFCLQYWSKKHFFQRRFNKFHTMVAETGVHVIQHNELSKQTHATKQ